MPRIYLRWNKKFVPFDQHVPNPPPTRQWRLPFYSLWIQLFKLPYVRTYNICFFPLNYEIYTLAVIIHKKLILFLYNTSPDECVKCWPNQKHYSRTEIFKLFQSLFYWGYSILKNFLKEANFWTYDKSLDPLKNTLLYIRKQGMLCFCKFTWSRLQPNVRKNQFSKFWRIQRKNFILNLSCSWNKYSWKYP